MSTLLLSLLGSFEAARDGQLIKSFRTSKVQALLILLATEPGEHSRERLMTLLWPGMPERSARHNLRQSLYHLRTIIPDADAEEGSGAEPVSLILANRQSIELNPAAQIEVDISRFEALIDGTLRHDHMDLFVCPTCRHDLEAAVALYRGDFLADFYLEDSNEFDEWSQTRRETYRRKMLDSLEILTTIRTRQQEYGPAAELARRQLEIDNLRESAYRQLMEILALNGRRSEAMAVYDRCRRLLAEELGMAPSKRTTQIYDKIVAGDLRFDTPAEQGIRGYQLADEIGSGAYGSIYRAVQPSVGREVAVKVIRRKYANDPEFVRRFEAEAQMVARIEHPYIVPLYDYWRDPEGAYLVMRYLRGGNLQTALKNGPWDLDQAARLLDQVAVALAAAHRAGVVHRDIKPANILLDETGNAFLTDFGIAKDLTGDMQLTGEGAVIGTPDYISPEQILSGPVTSQTDIYSLGAVLYETLTGEKPFPDSSVANLIYKHLHEPIPLVSDSRPGLPPLIDAVIQRATAKEPADRYATALEMAEAFRLAAMGEEAGAAQAAEAILPLVGEVYNPYVGLRAFQEADADDFFGREALVQQIIARLNPSVDGRITPAADPRFLALVGPSGSGKSSVVKAGLIPALRDGAIPGSEKWFVAEMTPGAYPLEELELALWPVAVDAPPSLVEPMRRDTRGMLRTIRRILPDEPGAQLLLIIDQFEELFTLVDDDQRRDFFLDSLLQALSSPRSPLRVVITLRADFYDRPLQYEALGRLLKQNTEIILPLTSEELGWAIREPARRVGVRLEQGLAETIIADLADQPGSLPMLQYALTELFERREEDGRGPVMSGKAYGAIGGVLGAIGRRAEEVYGGLDPAQQEATRQLFLRLVTLGEGTEDTRRRIPRAELEALAPALEGPNNGGSDTQADNLQLPVDAFGAARLLTFDHDPISRGPTVEVAHEALLREWARLRGWLDQSRDDVRMQRLLAAAAREWQAAGRDPGYLLRQARLDHFAGWAATSSVALTGTESEFLQASVEAREDRRAEEAARQKRELETAQKLAETERARAEEQERAASGLRRRAYILGGVLVVAVLLAIVAFFFAQQSSDNAAEAQANAQLAATREAEAVAESDRADAERDAAINAQATAEAEGIRADEQRDAALAAEAEALAAEEEAVAAQAEAVAQAEIARFNEAQAQSLALTAAAKEAFTGGRVDLALALAVQAVDVEQPPAEAVRTLNDVAFSYGTRHVYENENSERLDVSPVPPDGSPIISLDGGRTVTVWDPNSGEMLNQFEAANEDATFDWVRVAIPESTYIAIGYDSNELVVWDWSTGEKVQTWSDIDMDNIWDIYAGPDGKTVIYASRPGRPETEVDDLPAGFHLTAWEIESGEQVYRLDGERGERITWVEFMADNNSALIGTSLIDEEYDYAGGSRLRIFDLETGAFVSELALDELAGNNIVSSMAVNPARDQAFVIIRDPDATEFGKTGVFMSLPAGEVLAAVAFDDEAVYANYSPDGTLLAIERDTGSNNYFTLFDAVTGEELRQFGSANEGHFRIVNRAGFTFTPDRKRLVSADQGGGVLVWDVETGKIIQRLYGHGGEQIFRVTLSPDGRTAITNGGGLLNFWDIAEDASAQVFEAHDADTIFGLAISPDGTKAISTGLFAPDEAANEAILWDTNTFEVIHRLPGPYGSAVFLPDGSSAVLGEDLDKNIFWEGDLEMALVHWDLESGEVLNRTVIPDSAVAIDMQLSPDGKSLLAGTISNNLVHFDLETFTLLNRLTSDNEGEWFISTTMSPDGQTALAGGDLGDIVLFDLETGEEIRRYNPGSVTTGLAMSADGQAFVSAGSDHTLVRWDLASGEAVQKYNGHTNEVTSVAFTPDEGQMISASADGTLILWDVASGEPLRTFREHKAYINKVVLSPDGQLAYSSADDGTVIVRPIVPLPVDDILGYIAENRVLRDFTCVERKQFRILPLCDADGLVPDSGN